MSRLIRGWMRWASEHDWWERLQMINLLVVLLAFQASHLPDEVQDVHRQILHALTSPPKVPEEPVKPSHY